MFTVESCDLALSHYIVVRQDLPSGIKLAQAVHAAGESGGNIPPDTCAIVLETDADSLLDLEAKLWDDSVPYSAIRETSSPYNGQLLAIGICPGDKEKIEKYTSTFRLAR